MKRLLLAVAIAAAVLVPAAGASQQAAQSLRGTVVGKDSAHRGLVVALSSGAVRTVVAPSAFTGTDIGRQVVVRFSSRTSQLPVALSVSARGRSSHAVVRGTVVRLVKRHVVLSAGGSAVTVSLKALKGKRALASAQSDPQVGDTVKVEVEIDDNGSLAAGAVAVTAAPTDPPAGSEGELEVRGKVKDPLSTTSITVVTGTGIEVTCAIPTGVILNVQVDALVELKCDLIGGIWTVRRAHGENDHTEQGTDGSKIEVRGTITALTTSITVSPAGDAPVTCTIPTGVSLTQFAVNDVVKMECTQTGATLTLKEIEKNGLSGEHSGGDGHGGDHGGSNGHSGSDDD